MMSTRRFRGGWPGVASIALAATLAAEPALAAGNGADVAPDVGSSSMTPEPAGVDESTMSAISQSDWRASSPVVKAAFLYNFAKFVEWPALPAGAPIVVCLVGNDGIAGAFAETVRGQNIAGHSFDVWVLQDSARWRACNLLFIADAEIRRSAGGLNEIKTLPVLTVSDGKGFSLAGGIIELFVEDERMRFAINLDAADRSGLRLSSRLLGLAKVIRNSHVQ
jgi:hypothetical protein